MTSSTVSSLFSILDSRKLGEIATHLGEPPQAVSMGLETATASLIGGMANKTGDSTWMSQIFNLVSQAPSNVNVSDLANTVTGPSRGSPATSSLLDAGRSFLSLIFGPNQASVTDAVGKSTGLRSSVVASLMSMAAPLLMTTLGRQVRDGHMNASGLKELVMHEFESVRSLLPPGFSELLRGGAAPASTASTRPVALGTVAEPASRNWLWIIPALLILFPLLYWGWARMRMPTSTVAPLGSLVTRNLPGNVSLNIPQYGMESQLLGFIQDPAKGVDRNLWINYDRLLFNTDSATLRPESGEQLRNIAAILVAYPNVHVKIGGYTDNSGDSQHNLKLSQDRANTVMAELVTLGVSPDRMEAQGYGDQHPVASNSTAEGRARNRRVAMNVTRK